MVESNHRQLSRISSLELVGNRGMLKGHSKNIEMRLPLLIIVIGLILSHKAWSQTYSSVIDDGKISEFIQDEIDSKFSYSKKHERRWYHFRKRIKKSPTDWNLANWEMRWEQSKIVDFHNKFFFVIDSLKKYFTEADMLFLEQQYNAQRINDWSFKPKHCRVKKSYKIDFYEFTIPLFSKDFETAIFYNYYLCGSLCAYSGLWIYKWDGEKWVQDKYLKGWMS